MTALLLGVFAHLSWRFWAGLVACAAIAGALLAFMHHERAIGYARGHAEAMAVQARWDAARQAEQAAADRAQAENQAETARRLQDQQEIVHAAQAQTRQAQSDAAAAADAAGRLRVAAYLAADRRAAADPPAAAGSAPAARAELLPELFGRLATRAAELAGLADAARIAGQACEASYDALRH